MRTERHGKEDGEDKKNQKKSRNITEKYIFLLAYVIQTNILYLTTAISYIKDVAWNL